MVRRPLVLFGLIALLTVAPTTTDGSHVGRDASAATFGAPLGGVALVDTTTGVWHLQRPGSPPTSFYFGNPGDEPFLGDWDCDGEASPGLYRRSDGFVYLRNANTAGTADIRYYFGNPGDLPIAGDFDGDGCDTVSIHRRAEGRAYVINRIGTGDLGLGAADYSFPFGRPGDVLFAGDFDGDGIDTVAGYRPATSTVIGVPGGAPEFGFGDPGDRILAVSMPGGRDAVAVYRPADGAVHVLGGTSLALTEAGAGVVPVAGAMPTTVTAPAAPPPAANSPTDTNVYPGENIQQAVDANPPGATIKVMPGIHRMQTVVPKDGQTIAGEPGAVLNGARLLTDFVYESNLWVATGQTQQGQLAGVCAPYLGKPYDGCRHPEDVYYDDVPLRQVTDAGDMGPGRWYFDYEHDRIYLADDPAGHKVEASVTRHAVHFWHPGQPLDTPLPGGVTIRGLIVEKYANPAQRGAIQAGGYGSGGPDGLTTGWVITGNELRLNHGAGVRTGNATLVAGNHIHHNGQAGVRSDGKDAVVDGNEISYNNTLGFDPMHDAAGFKFGKTRRLTISNNYVHNNNGPGLWADTDNDATRYLGNRVEDNLGPGIFHEVSYSAEIAYNEVYRNGFATADWMYGGGILVAHSPDVVVHHNRLSDNADGIVAIDQARGAGELGPYVLDRLWVHDNVVEITQGWVGVAEDTGDMSVYTRDIKFERNTYRTFGHPRPFKWNDAELTAAEWQTAGFDVAGSITP